MDTTDLSYEQYNVPDEIWADISLTRDQKIALLELWVADEEALARAAQEGLNGGEQNHLQAATEALRIVLEDQTSSNDNIPSGMRPD